VPRSETLILPLPSTDGQRPEWSKRTSGGIGHNNTQQGAGYGGKEGYESTPPPGTEGSSSWVKWPRREADHSPLSSAEVKYRWSYISTPHTSSWRGA